MHINTTYNIHKNAPESKSVSFCPIVQSEGYLENESSWRQSKWTVAPRDSRIVSLDSLLNAPWCCAHSTSKKWCRISFRVLWRLARFTRTLTLTLCQFDHFRSSDQSGDGLIEQPVPKLVGVDIWFMSLSHSVHVLQRWYGGIIFAFIPHHNHDPKINLFLKIPKIQYK